MSPQSLPELTEPIRFAAFQLDPGSGVLRKHGIRIRLQDQPLRVLLVLIEKSGEVVTREELQRRLWPDIAFGDFDHSLNIAINKIREALGDSAATPRFIETVPRRGYRFIAPVEGTTLPAEPPAPRVISTQPQPKTKWIPLAASAGTALVLIAGIALWLSAPPSRPDLQVRRLTNDKSAKFGSVVSDGASLYFQAGTGYDSYIARIPLSGGEPAKLPVAFPGAKLLDITPDHQALLLAAPDQRLSESAPLWKVRIAGGSMQRVGELRAVAANYSPDGRQIVFTMGWQHIPGSLWIASSDGSNPRRLLELAHRDIVAPLWSPDGQRIVFGQRSQLNFNEATWEVMPDGSRAREVSSDHLPAGWTSDGRILLASGGRLSVMPSHRFFQNAAVAPPPLSSGEPRFDRVVASQGDRRLFAIGTTPLGELQRFDRQHGTWLPHLGGISAGTLEYSRDGSLVAYTTYPENELWIRHADGSSPVQITNSAMQAFVPRWSPDGRQVAFVSVSASDQLARICVVDAAGGTPRAVRAQGWRSLADFTWAPDGKRIIYHDSEKRSLWSLEISSGEIAQFPGSGHLYSPRWSPDGSMLAALDGDVPSTRPKLYEVSERKWRATSKPACHVTWPFWSHDSKFIWYLDNLRGMIRKYDIVKDRYADVLPVKAEELTEVGTPGSSRWFALTANDEPMTLRRRDIQQVYALDLKLP